MGGKYIYVKAEVETYLQKTFYNLTTVALHNWRTYGQMRALATHKYKVIQNHKWKVPKDDGLKASPKLFA